MSSPELGFIRLCTAYLTAAGDNEIRRIAQTGFITGGRAQENPRFTGQLMEIGGYGLLSAWSGER